MASVNHPPVSHFDDAHLNELIYRIVEWLSVETNRAKTGIPQDEVDKLGALGTEFNNYIFICGNTANRTQIDVTHKDLLRKDILAWVKVYFTPFIIENKHITDEERLTMGWYPVVPPRKEVPPPTAQTALQDKVFKSGRVNITVSHNEDTLGKPKDADGVELYYAIQDPELFPDTEWRLLEKYTKVRSEIPIQFAASLIGEDIWMKGRWYNHNGVSDWSEIITFTLRKS
jgi:hypothetical protein